MNKEIDTQMVNIQVLALIGDAVLSLYIRERLLKIGVGNSNKLQRLSTKYVSAKGEAAFLDKLIKKDILTKEELEVIKRGRNYKNSHHPKNTDIMTYKLSTGIEALLGKLYIDDKERLKEILNLIEVKQ